MEGLHKFTLLYINKIKPLQSKTNVLYTFCFNIFDEQANLLPSLNLKILNKKIFLK